MQGHVRISQKNVHDEIASHLNYVHVQYIVSCHTFTTKFCWTIIDKIISFVVLSQTSNFASILKLNFTKI